MRRLLQIFREQQMTKMKKIKLQESVTHEKYYTFTKIIKKGYYPLKTYGAGYVIVMVFVVSFHSTFAPRFSVTNLKGNIVLPLIISGITL